jgi:small subunit ribosomal protein S1
MKQLDNNQPLGEENKNNKEFSSMASLLKEEGLGLDFPKAGEIKTGTIASISPGQIMVSIGAKSEGIIGGEEFDLIPPEVFAQIEIGQDIPVYIITPEDSHGNIILSYVRALEAETWEEASEAMKENETADGKVVGYNRGGLIVSYEELRGFLPASLLAYSRRSEVSGNTPEERFGQFIGEEVTFQIIEVDQERRRLIFSEKAALNETRDTVRDKVIENLNIGNVREGRVTSLADFGAFVNINGADGLVHISEISWERIRHPSEVLKVGQEVEVKVISIDEEKRHIGLSIRRLQEDPWQESINNLRVGQLVEANITRLQKFGAFAMLENGVEGLIHISEIADEHISHPKEVLHEGDDVTLRIIKIEPESHRIGLSLRRVESLAYADMDMKELEKELEDSDIKLTSRDTEKILEEEASEVEVEEAAKASVEEAETVEEAKEEEPAKASAEEAETVEEVKEEETAKASVEEAETVEGTKEEETTKATDESDVEESSEEEG